MGHGVGTQNLDSVVVTGKILRNKELAGTAV